MNDLRQAMVVFSDRQMDELCECFEAEWQPSVAVGAEGIVDFLRRHRLVEPLPLPLIIGFIQVDLERQWMAWAKELRSAAWDTEAVEWISRFHQLPCLVDYRKLFADEVVFEESLESLTKIEVACRDQWGDAVGEDYYRANYGVTVASDSERSFRQMRLEVEGNLNHFLLPFPLRGKTIVGRQRTADSSDCFYETGARANRAVIAARTEAEISREQLSIQLLSNDFAVMTNLSQVNSVRVGLDKSVPPNESILCEFPFTLWLPKRRLVCF